MKEFRTLLWLECRRSRTWAAALLGSLVFWAWGMEQVTHAMPEEQLGIRAGLLCAAAITGLVVLAFMIGRFRSETRQGQYQILLLTPPSGYFHILARFTFALTIGLAYAVAIAGLLWWATGRAGLHLTSLDTAQLLLVCPLYGVGIVMAPLLAWTLLLMVLSSAYRISGTAWIPGTVMVAATPFVLRFLGERLGDVLYRLPGWRLFTGLDAALARIGIERSSEATHAGIVLPQEPLWGMLALAIVMLVLAGRIWQEVEA